MGWLGGCVEPVKGLLSLMHRGYCMGWLGGWVEPVKGLLSLMPFAPL